MIHLCDFLAQNYDEERDLFVYDMFAGKQSISRGFRAHGCKTDFLEFSERPEDDLLTVQGLCRATLGVLRLVVEGLAFAGLPCGSFVYLNRSSSKRSRKRPLGSQRRLYVKQANTLGARLMMLMLLTTLRSAFWETEQPGSSLFIWFPYLRFLARLFKHEVPIRVERFWMAWFGSRTPKPSLVVGTSPWAGKLYRKLGKADKVKLGLTSEGVVTKKRKADGSLSVSGGPKLKQTQVYPDGFGHEVAKLHLKTMEDSCGELQASVKYLSAHSIQQGGKKAKAPFQWKHADLEPVRKFPQEQIDLGKYEPAFPFK